MLIGATHPLPHQAPDCNRAMASRTLYFLFAGLHPTANRGAPIPGEPFHLDPHADGDPPIDP